MKTRKYKKSVKSKKSLKHRKKGQKGGAYGVTMNSLANNAKSNVIGYAGAVKYNHCGGNKNVNIPVFNNRVGHGYADPTLASTILGGYAPVSRYVGSQCGAGKKGKKLIKKKRKTKKNKTLKSRKHLKIKSFKKKKGKKRHTVKKHMNKKKRHQKGGSGYTQYQSNTPVGTSFESPNVTPPHNALAPLGIAKTQINCTDNYNHYKK